MNPDSAAHAFLLEAPQFRLGGLPTEMPHPATSDLAHLACHDLPAGIECLRGVDLEALTLMAPAAEAIAALAARMTDVLGQGGRIFLCGCGATGRLSLSLEVLWREQAPPSMGDRVQAFMAGGDLALVRSVEDFEDHPEHGARQLDDLGFDARDLLVATTEGGETPWVIGATERALQVSAEPPWFLYCNPDPILRETVERSQRVIDHPSIRKISLHVGPMALAGSTRMQASTVLMLAVGTALDFQLPGAERPTPQAVQGRIVALRDELAGLALSDLLAPAIRLESALYHDHGTVLYETDQWGITILTDTTERAPTFSLRPFENRGDLEPHPSLSYFHLPGTPDSLAAWCRLLHREPRPLDWPEVVSVAGRERLLGFDFSDAGRVARLHLTTGRARGFFRVTRDQEAVRMRLATGHEEADTRFPLAPSLLHTHLLLKMVLNMHSTLVMGRLGRYEQNLMTWVRPSNKKLIDRSIRYVQHLLERQGITRQSYEDIARRCFAEMASLGEDQPIVLQVYEALLREESPPAMDPPGA